MPQQEAQTQAPVAAFELSSREGTSGPGGGQRVPPLRCLNAGTGKEL